MTIIHYNLILILIFLLYIYDIMLKIKNIFYFECQKKKNVSRSWYSVL